MWTAVVSRGGAGAAGPAPGDRPCRSERVGRTRRVFILEQRAAENQREGDDAELRDVGAMIELRRTCRWRHGDAQILPVALGRVSQALDRRPEDVLNDH